MMGYWNGQPFGCFHRLDSERGAVMRLTAVVFLSCFVLAGQTQVSVSGPAGLPSNPNALTMQQPPTRPEDLCTVEGSVFNAATGAPLKKAAVVVNRTDDQP